MIRYRYVTSIHAPAPFVNVSVGCPTTGASAKDLPAQIDPAADRTVIPGPVVSALELVQVGRFLFEGFGGAISELPVYLVAIQIHDLPPRILQGGKQTKSLALFIKRGYNGWLGVIARYVVACLTRGSAALPGGS